MTRQFVCGNFLTRSPALRDSCPNTFTASLLKGTRLHSLPLTLCAPQPVQQAMQSLLQMLWLPARTPHAAAGGASPPRWRRRGKPGARQPPLKPLPVKPSASALGVAADDRPWAAAAAGGVSVTFPHCLVVKDGVADRWYFTAGADGSLRRKGRAKVGDADAVLAAFGRRGAAGDDDFTAGLGVVATFRPEDPSGARAPCVYLTRDDLRRFLRRDALKAAGTGVLQKFVPCRGRYAHSYRVTWRRNAVKIVRAVNKKTARLPASGDVASVLQTWDADEDSAGVHREELFPESAMGTALQHATYLIVDRLQRVAVRKAEQRPGYLSHTRPSTAASGRSAWSPRSGAGAGAGAGASTGAGAGADAGPEAGAAAAPGDVGGSPPASAPPSYAHILRSRVQRLELEFVAGADGNIHLVHCSCLQFSQLPSIAPLAASAGVARSLLAKAAAAYAADSSARLVQETPRSSQRQARLRLLRAQASPMAASVGVAAPSGLSPARAVVMSPVTSHSRSPPPPSSSLFDVHVPPLRLKHRPGYTLRVSAPPPGGASASNPAAPSGSVSARAALQRPHPPRRPRDTDDHGRVELNGRVFMVVGVSPRW